MKALRERDMKGELIKFKNEDCFKAFSSTNNTRAL